MHASLEVRIASYNGLLYEEFDPGSG
jgi:hypothetical protein